MVTTARSADSSDLKVAGQTVSRVTIKCTSLCFTIEYCRVFGETTPFPILPLTCGGCALFCIFSFHEESQPFLAIPFAVTVLASGRAPLVHSNTHRICIMEPYWVRRARVSFGIGLLVKAAHYQETNLCIFSLHIHWVAETNSTREPWQILDAIRHESVL